MKFQLFIFGLWLIWTSASISEVMSVVVTNLMAEIEKRMPRDTIDKFRDTPIETLLGMKESLKFYSLESLTYLALRIYQEPVDEYTAELLNLVDLQRLLKYRSMGDKIDQLDEDCYYNIFYRVNSFLLNAAAYDIRQQLYDFTSGNYSNLRQLSVHDLYCLEKRFEKFKVDMTANSSECNNLLHFFEVQIEAKKIIREKELKRLLIREECTGKKCTISPEFDIPKMPICRVKSSNSIKSQSSQQSKDSHKSNKSRHSKGSIKSDKPNHSIGSDDYINEILENVNEDKSSHHSQDSIQSKKHHEPLPVEVDYVAEDSDSNNEVAKPKKKWYKSTEFKAVSAALLALAAGGGATIGVLKLLCSRFGKCYGPFSKDTSISSDDFVIPEEAITDYADKEKPIIDEGPSVDEELSLSTLSDESESSNLNISILILLLLLIIISLVILYKYRKSRLIAQVIKKFNKSAKTVRKSFKRSSSKSSLDNSGKGAKVPHHDLNQSASIDSESSNLQQGPNEAPRSPEDPRNSSSNLLEPVNLEKSDNSDSESKAVTATEKRKSKPRRSGRQGITTVPNRTDSTPISSDSQESIFSRYSSRSEMSSIKPRESSKSDISIISKNSSTSVEPPSTRRSQRPKTSRKSKRGRRSRKRLKNSRRVSNTDTFLKPKQIQGIPLVGLGESVQLRHVEPNVQSESTRKSEQQQPVFGETVHLRHVEPNAQSESTPKSEQQPVFGETVQLRPPKMETQPNPFEVNQAEVANSDLQRNVFSTISPETNGKEADTLQKPSNAPYRPGSGLVQPKPPPVIPVLGLSMSQATRLRHGETNAQNESTQKSEQQPVFGETVHLSPAKMETQQTQPNYIEVHQTEVANSNLQRNVFTASSPETNGKEVDTSEKASNAPYRHGSGLIQPKPPPVIPVLGLSMSQATKLRHGEPNAQNDSANQQ